MTPLQADSLVVVSLCCCKAKASSSSNKPWWCYHKPNNSMVPSWTQLLTVVTNQPCRPHPSSSHSETHQAHLRHWNSNVYLHLSQATSAYINPSLSSPPPFSFPLFLFISLIWKKQEEEERWQVQFADHCDQWFLLVLLRGSSECRTFTVRPPLNHPNNPTPPPLTATLPPICWPTGPLSPGGKASLRRRFRP